MLPAIDIHDSVKSFITIYESGDRNTVNKDITSQNYIKFIEINYKRTTMTAKSKAGTNIVHIRTLPTYLLYVHCTKFFLLSLLRKLCYIHIFQSSASFGTDDNPSCISTNQDSKDAKMALKPWPLTTTISLSVNYIHIFCKSTMSEGILYK